MKAIHYIFFFILYITLIGFIIQRKRLNYALKVTFAYLVVFAIVNTLAMYLRVALGITNNLFLFHLFTPIEYILVCLIYYRSFEESFYKKGILWSMCGFAIVCLLLSFFVEDWQMNNSYAKIIESLLITVCILLYFRQLLSADKVVNFNNDPLVWVSLGLLTYFIGNLFIEGLFNLLVSRNRTMANDLYTYTYLFEFNLFLQINIALFCHRIFRNGIKT